MIEATWLLRGIVAVAYVVIGWLMLDLLKETKEANRQMSAWQASEPLKSENEQLKFDMIRADIASVTRVNESLVRQNEAMQARLETMQKSQEETNRAMQEAMDRSAREWNLLLSKVNERLAALEANGGRDE